jgi:hypothetical protein
LILEICEESVGIDDVVLGAEEEGIVFGGISDLRIEVQLLDKEFDGCLMTFLDGVNAI